MGNTGMVWISTEREFTAVCGLESCRRPRCLPRRISDRPLRQIVAEGYDGVIAVMLSSGLSGTYNLARVIAEECRDRIPVRVFDSLSGSLGQGLTVLQLAEDIRSGMGWEELTERRAPQLIAATTPFFSVDTLEYLQKAAASAK